MQKLHLLDNFKIPDIRSKFKVYVNPLKDVIYNDCLKWYTDTKSWLVDDITILKENEKLSQEDMIKRFDAQFELIPNVFPKASYEMLYHIINLNNIASIYDDFSAYNYLEVHKINFHKIMSDIFYNDNTERMSAPIKGLKTSLNYLLSLTKSEFQKQRLKDDVKFYLWGNLVNVRVKPKFNDINSYLVFRRNDGFKMFFTILEVSSGYDFPVQVYERDSFLTTLDLCLDHLIYTNDIYSFRKELKTEDVPCNSLLLFGPDIEDNLKKVIELIYDSEDKILKIIEQMREESWIVGETDYMNYVLDYVYELTNFCAGNLKWLRTCQRYKFKTYMSLQTMDISPFLCHPIKYYKQGKNFREDLFMHVAKGVEEQKLKVVCEILNLLNLSAIILDDVMDKSTTRRNQVALHIKFGIPRAINWALGLSHEVIKLIRNNFSKETAWIIEDLYNFVVLRTCEGQDLDITQECRDYSKIAEYKTGYYTVNFVVAIAILLITHNIDSVYQVLNDKDLLRVGFWYQAEDDFRGNFEEDNMDIENKTWTILVDLLSKKIENFEYPSSKDEAIKLFEEYDIYDTYISKREAGLNELKKIKDLRREKLKKYTTNHIQLDKEETIILQAIEFSLEFFENKYKITPK